MYNVQYNVALRLELHRSPGHRNMCSRSFLLNVSLRSSRLGITHPSPALIHPQRLQYALSNAGQPAPCLRVYDHMYRFRFPPGTLPPRPRPRPAWARAPLPWGAGAAVGAVV